MITVHGARLHNLKNITVQIPKQKLVAVTGRSGSGKSALAFDLLHREGQRQYFEASGWIAYKMARPPVDRIDGLAPTISVEQNQSMNRSPRSTVGTETDVYTYLRLLFARAGRRPCPACGREIGQPYLDAGDAIDEPDEAVLESIPCPHCGAPVERLSMAHFSFNKPVGACPTCTGLGTQSQVDVSQLIDEERPLLAGAVQGWGEAYLEYQSKILAAAARHYGIELDLGRPILEYGQAERDLLLYGVGSPQFRRHFPGVEPPATARAGRFEGIVTGFMRRYAERIEDPQYREKMERHIRRRSCPDCGGHRLRAESRAVTVAGRSIVELAQLPLAELDRWVAALPEALGAREWRLVQPLIQPAVAELRERLRRILKVGLGYLTLDRSSPTLSAGEAQRLRLATLLGSELSGIIYILDEPTAGLHQRDTGMLVDILRQLRDRGNTVIVIEHDLELIRAADHVIDMGPGAGRYGGEVVAAGPPSAVAEVAASPTGRFLAGTDRVPVPPVRRQGDGGHLLIRGARAHNLKNLTVRLPLGRLVAVTGVSGSGKSTLLFDVLGRAGRQRLHGAGDPPAEHDGIEGWEQIDRIVTIDQEPMVRIPRSNVATYTDLFAAIRKVFAGLPEARERGLGEGHFSFNVPGGRCERCQGTGVLTVPMQLLPDAEVQCPACRGRRFREEVLAVRYEGRSIADVLEMTVQEAASLFRGVQAVESRLSLMMACGLGYLTLGQPATTLSGGEAQRLKLVKELGRPGSGRRGAGRRGIGRTLYLLDEPSRGLHPADTASLIRLLQGLVDAGHSVAVVEHNLDVVRAADWVIDLGPEGGEAGGYLVAEGTPEEVAAVEASYTGRLIRPLLG